MQDACYGANRKLIMIDMYNYIYIYGLYRLILCLHMFTMIMIITWDYHMMISMIYIPFLL